MVNEDRVEQRAKAVSAITLPGFAWDAIGEGRREQCRLLARAELEREEKLVEAAEALAVQGANYYGRTCVIVGAAEMDALRAALARHRTIDAPPQRTVEQIARELLAVVGETPEPRGYTRVPIRVLDELAAALKRKDA